jgi:hypothetical protein
MKKLFILLLFGMVALGSCERDDICIDEITPRLIIRFYDYDNQTETKNIKQLSVKIIGTENDSLLFSGTDSIFIPLKTTENSTQYVLTVDSNSITELNRDTITVNYTPDAVFIGRSCGYKSVFNNTTYTPVTDKNMWIQKIQKITEQIENETTAHVKIFH